jgi:hypothetical protein
MTRQLHITLILLLAFFAANSQQRSVHYRPAGNDFTTTNGTMRFNRALYGGNTAFRVEAGDLPEFALYLPGMGGNLKFGIISGTQSKWLTQLATIKATYRPGAMIYEIKDALLGAGTLQLTVLATQSQEAIIVQVIPKGIPAGVQLFTAFGGVTGKKFSRDGDIGADPESSFYLQPAYCINNSFDITGNNFTLSYGDTVKPVRPLNQVDQTNQSQSGQTVEPKQAKRIEGIFPATISLHISSANRQQSPLSLDRSATTDTPLVCGKLSLKNADTLYYLVRQPGKESSAIAYKELPAVYKAAEAARKTLAERVQLRTPDAWINLGVAHLPAWCRSLAHAFARLERSLCSRRFGLARQGARALQQLCFITGHQSAHGAGSSRYAPASCPAAGEDGQRHVQQWLYLSQPQW